MKKLILLSLMLTGCAMTFQPFQPVSREEFTQAQQNILAVAQAVAALQKEKASDSPEVKK